MNITLAVDRASRRSDPDRHRLPHATAPVVRSHRRGYHGILGTWRSLVACLHGAQEVPGSNPGVPTSASPSVSAFLGHRPALGFHGVAFRPAFACARAGRGSHDDGGRCLSVGHEQLVPRSPQGSRFDRPGFPLPQEHDPDADPSTDHPATFATCVRRRFALRPDGEHVHRIRKPDNLHLVDRRTVLIGAALVDDRYRNRLDPQPLGRHRQS